MLKTFLRGVVITGYPLIFKIEYYKTDKWHQEEGWDLPLIVRLSAGYHRDPAISWEKV